MLKKCWGHFDLSQPTGSTLGPKIPTPSHRILIGYHSAHSWHSHFTFKVKSIMKLETSQIQKISIWCHQPKMRIIVWYVTFNTFLTTVTIFKLKVLWWTRHSQQRAIIRIPEWEFGVDSNSQTTCPSDQPIKTHHLYPKSSGCVKGCRISGHLLSQKHADVTCTIYMLTDLHWHPVHLGLLKLANLIILI